MTIVFQYTEYTDPSQSASPTLLNPGVNVQFRLGVNPFAGDVSSTGTVIQDVPNLSSTGGANGTWEERRITFTPSQLGFVSPGSYSFYLGSKGSVFETWAFVDGLVVNVTRDLCPPTEPTPEPTTPPTTRPT